MRGRGARRLWLWHKDRRCAGSVQQAHKQAQASVQSAMSKVLHGVIVGHVGWMVLLAQVCGLRGRQAARTGGCQAGHDSTDRLSRVLGLHHGRSRRAGCLQYVGRPRVGGTAA